MEKSYAPVGRMTVWSHGNKVMWCITDHISVGLTVADTEMSQNTLTILDEDLCHTTVIAFDSFMQRSFT